MAPGILRTGVDMVDVTRLSDMIALSGQMFLDSSWTAAECRYCAGRAERLAARWAAKEATMKALGCGLGTISPLEIEVRAREGEPPALLLYGHAAAAARRLGLDTWSLSLTHERPWALAFVVGMGSTSHEHPA